MGPFVFNLARIAVRNVLRNKRRTAITLAALVVGVGVMVSVRGLLNGLQASMIETVTKGQVGALQVHRKGYLKNVLSSPLDLDLPADPAFLKKIETIPHVTAVAPRIMFGGMVNLDDETIFVQLLAVDPVREFTALPKRREVLSPGAQAFATGASDEAIVVTDELGKGLLGAKRKDFGGPTAVLAPDRDGALKAENARVVGTMTLTSPGEKKVALVHLGLAQRLLGFDGRATELAIAVDDLAHAEGVAALLRAALGPDYEVHHWDEVALFFKDIIRRENIVLQLIASVFMILMLIGVANTMLMSVIERTREIGTMMAVGVRRARIVVLFLFEAATIGLLGGVAGGAVGIAVVAWLARSPLRVTLPASPAPFVVTPYMTAGYVGVVILIASGGALLFAVYPAWRASRLRPVQALAGG